MMSEGVIFDVVRQAFWLAALISAPLLGAALVMGVVVGLFQALTSVQEMTLTFVPKVGAMIVMFWLSVGFMTSTLVDFFQMRLIPLIQGGG
jgi:flagellar biosynthetic protein FliQ